MSQHETLKISQNEKLIIIRGVLSKKSDLYKQIISYFSNEEYKQIISNLYAKQRKCFIIICVDLRTDFLFHNYFKYKNTFYNFYICEYLGQCTDHPYNSSFEDMIKKHNSKNKIPFAMRIPEQYITGYIKFDGI